MINKIKAKRLFDKNNKGKHPIHKDVPDGFDPTHIIMRVHKKKGKVIGIMSCTEDMLFHLGLDDAELDATGWRVFRDELIADGTITQADINIEKVKPIMAQKLIDIRAALK